MKNKTPFITFEGGEGSGKTTQIKLLAEWIRGKGIEVVTSREPGGTEGAEAIRDLLVQGNQNRWDRETDTLLLLAARRHNLVQLIWPAMEQEKWVLCDRFMDSTYAYQCYGRGLDVESVRPLYHFIAGDFTPDLTFFMDIDVHMGLERAVLGKGRALHENRYENYDISFHQNLRQGYIELAKQEPHRFVTIDASPDIETIQKSLQDIIIARFLS